MDIIKKLKSNQRRIGLTGGIASGKTTITNYIRKHKNIPILDADNLSRELIKPNTYGPVSYTHLTLPTTYGV